jgi:hypothetical protein
MNRSGVASKMTISDPRYALLFQQVPVRVVHVLKVPPSAPRAAPRTHEPIGKIRKVAME